MNEKLFQFYFGLSTQDGKEMKKKAAAGGKELLNNMKNVRMRKNENL